MQHWVKPIKRLSFYIVLTTAEFNVFMFFIVIVFMIMFFMEMFFFMLMIMVFKEPPKQPQSSSAASKIIGMMRFIVVTSGYTEKRWQQYSKNVTKTQEKPLKSS